MKETSRSPIKDKPLRAPGQSLQEERDAIWEDKLEPWLLLAAFVFALALWEWFRYFRPMPPQPWLMSACAVGVLGFAAWRLRRHRPRIGVRQGIEGEKAVGQFLDRLRGDGYHVFHDVQGDGFNIDHVLIGAAGVFTVETKTWSKPTKGDARIYMTERVSLQAICSRIATLGSGEGAGRLDKGAVEREYRPTT